MVESVIPPQVHIPRDRSIVGHWCKQNGSKMEPGFGVARCMERREILRAWGLMLFALIGSSFRVRGITRANAVQKDTVLATIWILMVIGKGTFLIVW